MFGVWTEKIFNPVGFKFLPKTNFANAKDAKNHLQEMKLQLTKLIEH